MKRLKYQCPFGGKQYPIYAAFVSFMLAPMIGIPLDVSFTAMALIMAGLPVAALIVCFFIEQHLTAGERAIIADTAYPLWMPAPPELQEAVRNAKSKPSPILFTLIIPLIGLEFAILFPEHSEPNKGLAMVILLLYVGVFLADWFMRGEWQHADDTTVYTMVDIHHMYDVEHHDKHNTWTVSYLVFYQPDGRYVLRAERGMGNVNSIYILKYRGMVIWIPAYDYSIKLNDLH